MYSQQVESNRAFNMDSMVEEVEIYSGEKIHQYYKTECAKKFKILWIPLFCMINTYLPDEEFDPDGEGEEYSAPVMETINDFAMRNW